MKVYEARIHLTEETYKALERMATQLDMKPTELIQKAIKELLEDYGGL